MGRSLVAASLAFISLAQPGQAETLEQIHTETFVGAHGESHGEAHGELDREVHRETHAGTHVSTTGKLPGGSHAEPLHDAGFHAAGFHGPHHLSMLSADTHVRGHGDFATLGIDYEYRVSQLLGLGFVLEQAFDGLDATTALVVADVHLHRGLIMQLGPGFEWVDNERIAVARVGMLYEFEFAKFTLSPQLHWDFHDGHDNAVVAGLAFGFAF